MLTPSKQHALSTGILNTFGEWFPRLHLPVQRRLSKYQVKLGQPCNCSALMQAGTSYGQGGGGYTTTPPARGGYGRGNNYSAGKLHSPIMPCNRARGHGPIMSCNCVRRHLIPAALVVSAMHWCLTEVYSTQECATLRYTQHRSVLHMRSEIQAPAVACPIPVLDANLISSGVSIPDGCITCRWWGLYWWWRRWRVWGIKPG